jgi:hypothetical protein
MLFAWIMSGVFVGGLVVFFRWLFKWRDPDWDTEEKRGRAFLWSKNAGGGGGG